MFVKQIHNVSGLRNHRDYGTTKTECDLDEFIYD